ncbi:MAG: FAD-dependent oxidoreductase [Alphaproteobacteria bacterium]|nr:FAD-dependent oxidoreductase [Alphaproteobacteria bacterium]
MEVRAEGPNGKNLTVASDVVLVCVGRRPYTIGLNLEAIGVKSDKAGRIEVDNQYRTNVSNVRAIGDVIKGPMLAHKAEEDGVACVEAILGHGPGMFDYNLVPGVIYTHPELATVGKTEAALKAEKIPFQKGVFPYMANSRARCNQETDGFVKVLRDTKTDKILGGSILGATAGESIQELVVAIKAGMTAGDLGELVHAHPTLSEATKEAALKAQNNIAIHI